MALVVAEHPARVGSQEDVVVSGAVEMAGAGLDEHHLFPEDVSLRTAELHLGGDAGLRCAASAVGTNAAELCFVRPNAGAARQLEAHSLPGLRRPHAFLAALP